MSPCPRSSCLALISIALAAGCGSHAADASAPDAAPPSTIPISPAGVFAVTSQYDVGIPTVADPVVAGLAAATDGPDDPSRYLVDRMIAMLPDGTLRTIVAQAAPYVAAYLNDRLGEIAPRFMPGVAALAGGLAQIASHVGTVETLRIDDTGAGIRTITGVRFELRGTATAIRFADLGLPDLSAGVRVALDAAGRVTIGEHAHGLPYGAVLRAGLDRAVVPSVEPGAADLASALGRLVDCDRLGALVAEFIGLGSATLYRGACRTVMTAVASELDARLAVIDEVPLALEVTGTADGFDGDGDGTMDALRAGLWSGSLSSPSAREPIGAASFTADAAP